MSTSTVKYLGDLRTECRHTRSGDSFKTDAPTDNNGRGEAFSPTDTVATVLASCMMTIMGIRSRRNGWNIDGTEAEILKVMAADPRRISEVHIEMRVADRGLSDDARSVLEHAARNCPVAKSIHPDIRQQIEFRYIPFD